VRKSAALVDTRRGLRNVDKEFPVNVQSIIAWIMKNKAPLLVLVGAVLVFLQAVGVTVPDYLWKLLGLLGGGAVVHAEVQKAEATKMMAKLAQQQKQPLPPGSPPGA
jgi:hypothetical protein